MGLLEGARAVISGGGASVGRACVELFLKEGAQVAFFEIREERTREVVGSTGALGYTLDIADRSAVVAAMTDAAEKMRGITVLVNVASQGGLNRVHETPDEELDRMIAVNLKGNYHTTRAAIPHMLKAGKGAIVQVSTVGAFRPGYAEGSYCAAKAGQFTLSYLCAMEYSPIIRSNVIATGWIEDSPTSQFIQKVPEWIDPIMADHPMHRASKSMELAKVCLFLASDMSSAINGATIVADGGQTRTQPNLNATLKKVLEASKSRSARKPAERGSAG
ncbi:MAG: SDR family NAD(P)-dependent oxidoreductase [Chloroflexi bacterium]|nr:SDR family NAD(P)-dependent oxidoreductase [Chloroflexota bacterium]